MARSSSDSCSSSLLREIRVPYFRTRERIDALQAQLTLWAGTRWQHAGTRPNEMRCGVRGDCLFWVHVLKWIGALPAKIEIPDYRRMEASADKMAMLREKIEATGCAGLITNGNITDPPETRGVLDTVFMIGDVLLFDNPHSGVHCGLVVSNQPPHFVHLSSAGLIESSLNEACFATALRAVYRLVETVAEGGDLGPRSAPAATTEEK